MQWLCTFLAQDQQADVLYTTSSVSQRVCTSSDQYIVYICCQCIQDDVADIYAPYGAGQTHRQQDVGNLNRMIPIHLHINSPGMACVSRKIASTSTESSSARDIASREIRLSAVS